MNEAGMIIHDRSWSETGGNSDHVMGLHPDIGRDLQQQGYASVGQCTKFNANTEEGDNHPQLYKAWKVNNIAVLHHVTMLPQPTNTHRRTERWTF